MVNHHHQGLPFARICLELFPSILPKSKFGDVNFWPNKWRTSWLLENVSLLEPPPCQMVFSAIVFFDGVFWGQHIHVRSNNRTESESFLNVVQSHVFEVRHSTLTACRSSQWLLRLTQLMTRCWNFGGTSTFSLQEPKEELPIRISWSL